MKKNKYIILIASIVLFISSCVKEDFDDIPVKSYTFDLKANTTIAELKAMYEHSGIIEDDIIIKGTVISTDEFGNFYEEVVIQDSTGGIEIQVDVPGLYRRYPLGSMIYIKCKGLIFSDYRGVKQLTYLSNGSSGKLPEGVLDNYLFRSDEGIPILPKTLTISDLSEDHINTLVKLEDVEFIDGQLELNYADSLDDANRTLTDLVGNTIIVRTSDYATFADEQLPQGNGSIVAVYAVYGDDQQLYIRNTDEVDMEGSRIDFILNENFTSNLGDFTQYDVLGGSDWYWRSAVGETFANISGYSTGANEDWLFSPPIDLSGKEKAFLSFRHGVGYLATWDHMTVWISADYDGVGNPNTTGTWQEITGFNQPIPSGNWSDFESSGLLDISDFAGNSNIYIAFKYVSTSSEASTWEVATVNITAL